MTDYIKIISDAMRDGGYTTLKEFADAAVAAGFHDDENIDLAGFAESSALRPATQKED